MRIVSVFLRPRRDQLPQQSEAIHLRSGVGIDGDCHAKPLSPRQVLLVSTGAYDFCRIPQGSLRENLLIEADQLVLSSGSLLQVGADAAIRITFECEPCGRLNSIRPMLSKDIQGKRGYLGRVVRSGIIKPGDRVRVFPDVFSPFHDIWRERVIAIARMLPPDCFLTYGRLAELAGVPKSFCRAFPRLLCSQRNLPWKRILPTADVTPSRVWSGQGVFDDNKLPSNLKGVDL